MEQVQTELEALALCQKHCMKVEFCKNHQKDYSYVVINFAFQQTAGRSLVEAVNRVVEMYHTPRGEIKELPWYANSEALMIG